MVDHRGAGRRFVVGAVPAGPAHRGFRVRLTGQLEQHDVGRLVTGQETGARLGKAARLAGVFAAAAGAAVAPHHHHRRGAARVDPAVAGGEQQRPAVERRVVDQEAGAEADPVDRDEAHRAAGRPPFVGLGAGEVAVAGAGLFVGRLAETGVAVVHPLEVQLERVERGERQGQLEHHLVARQRRGPQGIAGDLLGAHRGERRRPPPGEENDSRAPGGSSRRSNARLSERAPGEAIGSCQCKVFRRCAARCRNARDRRRP